MTHQSVADPDNTREDTVLPAARVAAFHLAAPDGWCRNVCGRCARRSVYKVAPSRQLLIRADGLLAGRDGWAGAGLYGQFPTSRVYAIYGPHPVTCDSCDGRFRTGQVACGECGRVR